MLCKDLYTSALNFFNFNIQIDCFASRVNAQYKTYASRNLDPYATSLMPLPLTGVGIIVIFFPLLVWW